LLLLTAAWLLTLLLPLLLASAAGKPTYHALGLVGHLPCSILHLPGGLTSLIGSLSCRVLGLLSGSARSLLGLTCCLACCVLRSLRGLPCLVRSLSSGVLSFLPLLTLLVTFAHLFSLV
jgi:hypothetical protein